MTASDPPDDPPGDGPLDVPPSTDLTEEGLHAVGEPLPAPRDVRDPLVGVAAMVTALGGLLFAGGLLLGAPRTLYGGGLAFGLLALAFGLHRYLGASYPQIEAVEPRPGPEAEQTTFEDVPELPRRGFLGWILAAAAGVLGLSFLAPVASLGPVAGDALRRTQWTEGARLVTSGGRPLLPGDVAPGSLVTAWPEHAIEHERSAVIVVRLSAREPGPPTNPDWVVDDRLVAYSKICTHAGCPVGLFRERDDALFCPCHQATFDAAQAAEPVFGPAARRLPQLPLGLDDDGALVALGDFPEPIGPAFGWMDGLREEGDR